MHAGMHQYTDTHKCCWVHSGMNNPDDAWLVIIRLRMKIDWVPCEKERLSVLSLALFSCFNWTTWLCCFLKWGSHCLSLCLQRWINGWFYSNCCLRAHCHQHSYQRFFGHHRCFHHHCYYRCYRHYLIFNTTTALLEVKLCSSASSASPWSLAKLVPLIVCRLLLLAILSSLTPFSSTATQ